MLKQPGKFIVSLDFELMWGVRDVVTPQTYGEHLRGVHTAIPTILHYFTKYNVNGTFATVGFLFFCNKKDLLNSLPIQQPKYKDANLSPYGDYIEKNVGENSKVDPYHFGADLINLIKNTPNQEIGCHTFSHFYCLEHGQTLEDFKADIEKFMEVAKHNDITITSIVFPRNQINEDYLVACKSFGITNYRSCENSWIYSARSFEDESLFRRFFRIIDAYINISGHHCYADEVMKEDILINIPSSRFLRPYSKKISLLEGLRLRRIKKSMTHAAKHGLLYHLWWHPHNFGINQEQNFSFLGKILQHYTYLHEKYSFTSHTMSEYAELLAKKEMIS